MKRVLPSDRHKKILLETQCELWAELIFVFLPFIIIFVISTHKDSSINILYEPEWSMAASILTGQTIVRFISGLLNSKVDYKIGVVSLIVTILIAFILAPSLLVLPLIMISTSPETYLVVTQIVLFILAVLLFLFLGETEFYIKKQVEDE